MDYKEKTQLIRSLAESVGITEAFDTQNRISRYDATTGTFYCEGLKFPHSTIEDIKKWYQHQMEVYREDSVRDELKMQYYMRYAVAYNAICLLEDNMNTR